MLAGLMSTISGTDESRSGPGEGEQTLGNDWLMALSDFSITRLYSSYLMKPHDISVSKQVRVTARRRRGPGLAAVRGSVRMQVSWAPFQ